MKVLEITYDSQVRAGCIYFSRKSAAKTVACSDYLNLDLDGKGRPIGIEIFHPGTRQAVFEVRKDLSRLAREYQIPELRRLRPEKLAGTL